MADAASAMVTIQTMQTILQMIQTLTPTAYRYPPQYNLTDAEYFDFIVVGGGSAGSVLASRLSENRNVSVLLIEAGGYPPLESEIPAWFTLLANSVYDHNLTSVNDNVTAQNLQGRSVRMNQGNMLGGSSASNHMMHTRGDPEDYNNWCRILNDTKWCFDNCLKYGMKMETLVDPVLLKTEYAQLHGTDGPLKIARETHPSTQNYLDAFAELGHKIVLDITSTGPALGYCESLFEIADELRQSSALGYLSRAKHRPNLYLTLFSTATKVLIENKVAYGVQMTDANGNTLNVYANKEVILSAGAINSPKLLMLSGVGPKDHLESLGIDVIADLPVGENFQDHACAAVAYQMGECDVITPASNPHEFPAQSFNGYVSLNASQPYADYDTINLQFPCNSSDLLQLSVNMFRYSYSMSQKFYDASKDRKVLFTLLGLVMPKSRGKVLLASTDPTVDPLVYTGMFSDSDDIDLIARAFMDHNRVLNTTYFKSVDAKLVDTGLCKDATNDFEFWKCYAVSMSATMWHYAGTCAMGKVLNSDLQVLGIDRLRVVDSSAMPTVIRGKIYAGVMTVAEQGADIIRAAWNI